MNDAEIAEIREKLAWIQQRGEPDEPYFRDIYHAAWNLLAHIDAQAAEVERLKGMLVECEERLEQIADESPMAPLYIHASNVQTRFMYAQREARALRDKLRSES